MVAHNISSGKLHAVRYHASQTLIFKTFTTTYISFLPLHSYICFDFVFEIKPDQIPSKFAVDCDKMWRYSENTFAAVSVFIRGSCWPPERENDSTKERTHAACRSTSLSPALPPQHVCGHTLAQSHAQFAVLFLQDPTRHLLSLRLPRPSHSSLPYIPPGARLTQVSGEPPRFISVQSAYSRTQGCKQKEKVVELFLKASKRR